MTRTHHRHAVFLAAAAFGLPAPLYAREAHLVAGSTSAWTEIQGAAGPILAPNSTFTYPYLPYATTSSPYYDTPTLLGVASDGVNGYFLVSTTNFYPRTTSEAVWTYNLTTGTRTATTPIQLPAGDPGLSDIAFLNGTLYAVSGPPSTTYPASNGTTRIYSIGPSGTLTTVYSRTDSNAATPQIAANSQSNRLVLLPTSGPNNSPFTNTPQLLIDPSNWSVAQSLSGTAAAQISFNLDGSRLTEYAHSGTLAFANTYTVPGFTPTSPAPAAFGQAGSGGGISISDAFDYAYPSSSPAIVQLSQQGTGGRLLRTGQYSWQSATTIRNYALPDATSVDQVAMTNLTWTQTSGPAVETSTALSPAGPVAVNGTLAQTTFTVNATGAARGVYTVSGTATLQGHYTAPGTDETRPLNLVGSGPGTVFAVDPFNGNFVGNGDLELSNFGWTGDGPTYDFDTKSYALFFPANTAGPTHSSQSLELGTPRSPMMLSFDCRTDEYVKGYAALTVTLGGVPVAFLPDVAPSATTQHFSIYLSDPQLQGLSNPLLDLRATTSNGSFSSWLYVDNISLIAVPEPATLSLTAVAALPLFCRRRR